MANTSALDMTRDLSARGNRPQAGHQRLLHREMPEVALGEPLDRISGHTISDQLKAARNGGLLNGIDAPLASPLDYLVKWAASVRNQRGDAHPARGCASV